MGQTQLWLQKIPVFLPISFITVAWEFFVLLYVVTDFSLTILVQCFEDSFLANLLYQYFDRILAVVLALDILFSLNTCIIKRGVIISERNAIAKDYLKSIFFVVDSVSLALSLLQLFLNSQKDYQTYFNFLVFIKIIKVYQFDKNIKRYGLKSFNSLLIYQILKNIVFLALLCHIVGCFAYLIDYNLLVQNPYDDNTVYWLLASYAYPFILYEPFWVRYTYSFYYSTSILSGIAYGDLVPLNPIDTIYNFFILLLPLVIYSYIFNAIYDVISKKRQRSKQIKKYQFMAKRYFKTLRVKKNIQVKMITYLTYIFKKTVTNTKFVGTLAPSARKQYLTHTINAKFDFSIFEQLLSLSPITDSNIFRSRTTALITQEAFPQRYKMIAPPSKVKLYFINQGICKRVTITNVKYSDDITRKQYACFFPFLTGLIPAKLRYESASFVVSQTISRADFLALLSDRNFSELKEAFFLMMEQKLMYSNETVIGENCFFCHDQGHFLTNCKYLRPKIKSSQFATHSNYRRLYKRGQTRPAKYMVKISANKQIKQKKAQMGVQCDVGTQKQLNLRENFFQKVAYMRVYYPQFNIDS